MYPLYVSIHKSFEEARFKNVSDIQCLGAFKTQSFVQDNCFHKNKFVKWI